MLRKLKKTGGYDACISFLFSANAANVLSGHGCRTIISTRNNMSASSWGSVINKHIIDLAIRMLYNHADCNVAISKGVEEDLAIRYGIRRNRLLTIYNGYDIPGIQQKALEGTVERNSDEFVISTCGRLEFQKGQWHLIRCIYFLKEKYPNIRLDILGRGSYYEYFEEMIEKGNLRQNVRLLGFQENPFRWIGESDIFVFPSQHEGFGNALVEAMACKVPCIATDFRSGAREILAPDTELSRVCKDKVEWAKYGVITPVCSDRKLWFEPLEKEEQCLKEAIEAFILDRTLCDKYSELSQERAKMFSVETIVKEWAELICQR